MRYTKFLEQISLNCAKNLINRGGILLIPYRWDTPAQLHLTQIDSYWLGVSAGCDRFSRYFFEKIMMLIKLFWVLFYNAGITFVGG